MKTVKLYSLQDIRFEEQPIPEISSDEALVRMKACGICGSDTMDWYVEKKAPFALGHEPAGIVEKVGAQVTAFREGDRVFVHHHAPCFACDYCRKEQFSLCPTWKTSHLDPGGMSEFFRVPAVNLNGDTLKLPHSLTFEDGALIEPTACVVKSLRKAHFKRGHSMLVIGLGVMGQMHILLARHLQAGQLIGADKVPFRLQKALDFGADAVVDVAQEDLPEAVGALTRGNMVDTVIVGPGSVDAMVAGLQCAGKGGRVLFFTPVPENKYLEIQPYHLYFNEIDLAFSYSCGPPDTREALRLIREGVVTAKKLVTHRYPLKEARQAVANAVAAQDSLKTLVVN